MEIFTIILAIISAMGIPSAITGFCFWKLEQKMQNNAEQDKLSREKRQKAIDAKEKTREEHTILLIQSINASMALGEATAKAVQRIPDAHCNGDMHAALDYATKIKHEQKNFLTKQGVQNILD